MKKISIDLNCLNPKKTKKHFQTINDPIKNKIKKYHSNLILYKNNNLRNKKYNSPTLIKNIKQKNNIDKNMIYRHKINNYNYPNKNIERKYLSPSPKLRLNLKTKLNDYFITYNNKINISQN